LIANQIRLTQPTACDYDAWLDCKSDKTDAADRLLRDTAPVYQYYAVSSAVSNSRNEGPDLIKPMA
jgi:putative SOS response-associated peptidase YedK